MKKIIGWSLLIGLFSTYCYYEIKYIGLIDFLTGWLFAIVLIGIIVLAIHLITSDKK